MFFLPMRAPYRLISANTCCGWMSELPPPDRSPRVGPMALDRLGMITEPTEGEAQKATVSVGARSRSSLISGLKWAPAPDLMSPGQPIRELYVLP